MVLYIRLACMYCSHDAQTKSDIFFTFLEVRVKTEKVHFPYVILLLRKLCTIASKNVKIEKNEKISFGQLWGPFVYA